MTSPDSAPGSAPANPLPSDPLASLLAVLDLEELGSTTVSVGPAAAAAELLDPESGEATGIPAPSLFSENVTVFVGPSQKVPHGRVFGGQVLAQGVMACGRTVVPEGGAPARPIHSLHAYFMRPGDDTKPIHFAVERMRDGRSFSTRRVHAIQDGAPILAMSASFQEPAEGLNHQDPMPDVPGPDGIPSLRDVFGGIDHPGAKHLAEGRAIEQRHVEGNLFLPTSDERVASQNVWMRTIGSLPDDPLIHAAVLAYASDYSLLESILRRHGLNWLDRRIRAASLDHAMWFHRTVRADEWILYAQGSPSAQGGRGMGMGRMYAADGTLVASVAQEGMLRLKEEQDI